MTDIVRTIVLFVVHTPIWVWLLYALLLSLGIQRTRDGIVRLWRMLILPVVVTLLAASSIIGSGPAAVSATLLGFAFGTAAGWPLERPDSSRRLSNGKIWLRGEWLSLVQIGAVLVVRYATNAVGAMNQLLHTSLIWHLGTLFLCSVLSGIFLGRTVRRLRLLFRPFHHSRRARRWTLSSERIS